MKIFSIFSYSVRYKYKNHQIEKKFSLYTCLDNKKNKHIILYIIFFPVLIDKNPPLKKLLVFGNGKEKSLYILFPYNGSIWPSLKRGMRNAKFFCGIPPKKKIEKNVEFFLGNYFAEL